NNKNEKMKSLRRNATIALKSENWELSRDFTNYHSYTVLYVQSQTHSESLEIRKVSLEYEYEKPDLESWKNIRGPHPWEKSVRSKARVGGSLL
uniref:Uncharacterized protein n=1 Tax=Apteryx owenii TaxID=8824 RepID=A0A8B9QGB8_APTOW